MQSDIQIAQAAKLKPITEIAAQLGIVPEELECYGQYKAKLSDALANRLVSEQNGKLILVTAVNPTPAGEGKTTVSVGLTQAMAKIGKKAVVALREPSLGPVFGVKGGAAGGGYSQLLPMEDINLHFTGDMHAITAANNLLCAMLVNHIHQGNELGIDLTRVILKRCMDLNERTLREIEIALGSHVNGVPRKDGFVITVATEVMAILCLAKDLMDLKERLGNILVAYTVDDQPVYAKDLKANGAMAALLKDAIKPNLVQTLEGTPAFVHGGPFANIAHGCSSVRATMLGLKLADYCITEAGFGADLGAEKFMDIKCRLAGLKPDAIVLVATVRALKYNGGKPREELTNEDLDALEKGIVNLEAHIENLKQFGVPVVVTLNQFYADTEAEIDFIRARCETLGADFEPCNIFAEGGAGGTALAEKVAAACEQPNDFHHFYDLELTIKQKIERIAKDYYGAAAVSYSEKAEAAIKEIESLGGGAMPVCVAKTQMSLSDKAKLLGRPTGFTFEVGDLRLSAGAGFVVVLTSSVLTMPGLPKVPSAELIDVDKNGKITGLF